MKRILKAGIALTIVSMLFTGCGSNSLVSALGEGYQEIEWQVDPYDLENMPSYSKQNKENKFENLEGEQAFVIKDGHSKDPNDIENFEIGTLLDDGTFIYKYITKEDYTQNGGTAENAKIVHCAAAYNYRTKMFKPFHETSFTRTDQDKESFTMQLCDPDDGGDIFIYDNGAGYLYTSDGTQDYNIDIETFARKHFKGYEVVVTDAMTDGEYRIFVELAIEKEEISVPEEDGEDISEEEADKEAEEIDAEMEEKMIETVLVYELSSFNSTIDQRNASYKDQVDAWIAMADGKTFDAEPDPEADWETVRKQIPDQWGQAHLYNVSCPSSMKTILTIWGMADKDVGGTPVLTWKNGTSFSMENEYISSFYPEVDEMKAFTDLKENSSLSNVFILKGTKYCEVYGNVGSLDGYWGKTIERSYLLNTTKTEVVKKKNGVLETIEIVSTPVTEERTQTLTVYEYRDADLSGEYLESYYTLYQDDVNGLVDVYDGMVLCSNNGDGGDVMSWRKSDGSYEPLLLLPDDYLVDVFQQDNKMYVCVTQQGQIRIVTSISNEDVDLIGMLLGVGVKTTTITGQQLSEAIKPSDYEGTKVSSSYHDEYNAANEEDGLFIAGSGGMDANKLVRVSLSPQKDLLKKIENYGIGAGSSNASGNGWLLTSFGNGLVYVDDGSGKSFNLDKGTWYGTWKQGDKMISVGFGESSASYGTLDVAYARVKEYTMDDIYKSRLEEVIHSYEN